MHISAFASASLEFLLMKWIVCLKVIKWRITIVFSFIRKRFVNFKIKTNLLKLRHLFKYNFPLYIFYLSIKGKTNCFLMLKLLSMIYICGGVYIAINFQEKTYRHIGTRTMLMMKTHAHRPTDGLTRGIILKFHMASKAETRNWMKVGSENLNSLNHSSNYSSSNSILFSVIVYKTI